MEMYNPQEGPVAYGKPTSKPVTSHSQHLHGFVVFSL